MRLVYADREGNVFDHDSLAPTAMVGRTVVIPAIADFIPLPEGSRLFVLPHTSAVGYDDRSRQLRPLQDAHAVAAFLPPAYTRTLLPGRRYTRKSPYLPLWPYAAVIWHKNGLWGAATRTDPCDRWHLKHFDDRKLVPRVAKRVAANPRNRLIRHLANCACNYHCFAAKNFFMARWECPLPTSPVCNAACIGCLSAQPSRRCAASHARIDFVPSIREICEVAIPHLQRAPYAIVSFGQGCEGDPILQYKHLAKAIRKMRKETPRGVININTNASLPNAIPVLARAGLDSIRVSMSSPIPAYYHRYFQPRGYTFNDVLESMRLAKKHGLYLMLNLFVCPGVTDAAEEVAALFNLIDRYRVDMVQLRNLALDPRLYYDTVKPRHGAAIGIRNLIAELRRHFPKLRLGYFNRAHIRRRSRN